MVVRWSWQARSLKQRRQSEKVQIGCVARVQFQWRGDIVMTQGVWAETVEGWAIV
jgi:hypothetical protein